MKEIVETLRPDNLGSRPIINEFGVHALEPGPNFGCLDTLEPIDPALIVGSEVLSGDVVGTVRVNSGFGGNWLLERRQTDGSKPVSLHAVLLHSKDGETTVVHDLGVKIGEPLTLPNPNNSNLPSLPDPSKIVISLHVGNQVGVSLGSGYSPDEQIYPSYVGHADKAEDPRPTVGSSQTPKVVRCALKPLKVYYAGHGQYVEGTGVVSGHPEYGPAVIQTRQGKIGIRQGD